MRARHRHLLITLVAAVAVALAGQSATVPVSTAGPYCPASTTWDDALHRCV
jgi:hypothetical protein